jgi:hypothetical protein
MDTSFKFNNYDNFVFKKTSYFYVLYVDNENNTRIRRLSVGSNQITLHACRSLVALDKVSSDHFHYYVAQKTLVEFVKFWYLEELNSGTFVSMGYMKPNGTFVWTPYTSSNVPDDIRIFSGELTFTTNGSRVRSRTPPPVRSRAW